MKTMAIRFSFLAAFALYLCVLVAGIPTAALANGNCCECPGVGTPGYWMNHPEAWPVEEITIGGVTYTKEQAIEWMGTPVAGDKTITLFRALVAAKLNVLNCCSCCCITAWIASADAWSATYPVGSGVRANSSAWCEGEAYYYMLDLYNNGNFCAPSRDDLE